MTFGVRPTNRIDAAIAPSTALVFSILVAMLAPRYAQWYGEAMPALTRGFLACYPIWIAITAIGVVVQVLGKVLGLDQSSRGRWKALDAGLAIASVLVVVVGIIALMLPVLRHPLPI